MRRTSCTAGPPGRSRSFSALTEADGYRIDGQKAGDRFGRQVGLIGDFDGNGARDLVVGADMAARGTTSQNGELTIALLGKLVTTTTVAGPASVAPTQDATFTANVTKQIGDQTPLAEGTVSFTLAGTAIDGCSALPLVAGSASCTAAFADEVSGQVVAQYDGSSRLQSSDAEAGFAVVKTATTTALQSSLNDPKPGQLVQLRASVSDAGAAAVDAGTVKFLSDGEAITGCKAVALSGGDAVCTTTWSSRSEPEVTAEYSGTAVLAGSTSGAQTLVVGSNAVIKPSATPRLTYGTAGGAFAGEIRGGDDTATGTVEVRRGSIVLGRSSLQYGEYDIRLGATALAPGSHTLTLAYSGDSKNRGAERNISVVVAKASGKVSFTRSRSTLKRNQRLTVAVKVAAKGVVPTGKVQVKVGSKVVKTLTLKGGKARYRLSKFSSKGTKKISVVYIGSGTVAKAVSKTRKVVQK
ncbi:Ig-like domain repeat protein [Aeromicrobium sp. UC242_57]|uniref:Ig-like domain repeat protein n=1 Tax=Aeromicrobium sp. UC242_57 TaxID=3374624 RepID=UPI0037ACE40E